MSVKRKLLFEEYLYDEEAVLIALFTGTELYKIAYWINSRLKLSLKLHRQPVELVRKKSKLSFPLYQYWNEYRDLDFYLVSNKVLQKKREFRQGELLFDDYSTYFEYLIPERKDVDCFLKIEGANSATEWVNALKTLTLIEAVYSVDKNALKSYKNLIFE